MFFHYASSEDFRPKRLVFKGGASAPSVRPTRDNPFGIPSPARPESEKEKEKPAPTPLSRMTPEQRAEFDKREREYLERTRKEEYKLQGDVAESVRDRLKEDDAQEAITGFFAERRDAEYKPASWAKWNKEYAEKMGYEDPKEAQERIRAMQRVIFDQLGLHGDPSAMVDGKIGPYTLAAMAAYAGQTTGVRVPMPERNRALADKIAAPAEEKEEDEKRADEEAAKTEAAEAEKRAETIEAAGSLDPGKQWYLIPSDTSETGYELVSWKPLVPMSPINVGQDNREAVNSQKAGETITLNIDGEKVTLKKVATGSYTVEGSETRMDLQGAYREALRVANEKRNKKKPVTRPSEGVKPAPLAPPDRPDLAFLEWDPSKSTSKPVAAPTVADMPPRLILNEPNLFSSTPLTPWGGIDLRPYRI